MSKPSDISQQPSDSFPALVKKLIAGLLALNIFVYSLAALSLYRIWLQHEARVITSTQNLSRILVNSLADVVAKVNVVLLSVEDELHRQQLTVDERNKMQLSDYIARQHARIPELESILVADQYGDIFSGDVNGPVSPVNVADREYFQRVRETSREEFIFSKPIVSRISGQWVIPLVHPLEHPDGSFAGAILGVFSLQFFTKLFATVDTGKDGTIALRDLNLVGVARYPEPKGLGSTIGQKSTMKELIASIEAGNQAGIVKGVASVDNIRRIYSFQKVDTLPFYILVGQSSETYFKTFVKEALAQIAFVVLFTLASMLFARQLAEKWRREQQLKTELEIQVRERTRELAAANRQLAALSVTDGLTGIANRRKFDTTWESEWRRACRMGTSLAVAMLDIDFFKEYNDHYGHQAGDLCLQRVAGVLKTCIHRSGELAARYGGEEFVIVLPGISASEAFATVERIRASIEAEAIPHGKGTEVKVVTVSIGVAACHPQPDGNPDQLLHEADAALYLAKRQGRNQAVVAPAAGCEELPTSERANSGQC